jgi:hypothetical protein
MRSVTYSTFLFDRYTNNPLYNANTFSSCFEEPSQMLGKLGKERKPIDFAAKEAKYKALKIRDHSKFLSKVKEFTARKNLWYAVYKACNRFENFKDSEEETPWLVSKEHGHHVIKWQIVDKIHKEASGGESEEKQSGGESEEKQSGGETSTKQ